MLPPNTPGAVDRSLRRFNAVFDEEAGLLPRRRTPVLEKNDQITLDLFVDKWWNIGLSTEPADRPTAEWAIRWLYKHEGHLQPRIEWFSSPRKLMEAPPHNISSFTVSDKARNWGEANAPDRVQFAAMDDIFTQQIATPIDIIASRGTQFSGLYAGSLPHFIVGQFLSGMLGYYDYVTNVRHRDIGFEAYGLMNLAISAGLMFVPHDICYVSERPSYINLNENNQLHGENGQPAISYADGFKVWVHNGNVITESVANAEFSAKDVYKERNIELRRSMIDIYGTEKFLVDVEAKEVNTDGYGTLYQVEFGNDEPLTMVKVVNSTPEPDGTYKDYFLRVPPDTQTAEEAVAWTFNMTKNAYKVEAES